MTGVKLLSSEREQELRAFHDQRGSRPRHQRGCTLCRGRRARRLANELNKMFRDRDVERVRRVIRENIADATLAVLFVPKEYIHVVQAIVRQELGHRSETNGNQSTMTYHGKRKAKHEQVEITIKFSGEQTYGQFGSGYFLLLADSPR